MRYPATLTPMEVTSVRKEKLRRSIIARRHARGQSDLKIEFDQPKKMELSSSELEKKERRREQNRRAAQRCRSKKRMNQFNVIQNFERVLEHNRDLRREVMSLRRERDTLQKTLDRHKLHCPTFVEVKTEPMDEAENPEGGDSTCTASAACASNRHGHTPDAQHRAIGGSHYHTPSQPSPLLFSSPPAGADTPVHANRALREYEDYPPFVPLPGIGSLKKESQQSPVPTHQQLSIQVPNPGSSLGGVAGVDTSGIHHPGHQHNSQQPQQSQQQLQLQQHTEMGGSLQHSLPWCSSPQRLGQPLPQQQFRSCVYENMPPSTRAISTCAEIQPHQYNQRQQHHQQQQQQQQQHHHHQQLNLPPSMAADIMSCSPNHEYGSPSTPRHLQTAISPNPFPSIKNDIVAISPSSTSQVTPPTTPTRRSQYPGICRLLQLPPSPCNKAIPTSFGAPSPATTPQHLGNTFSSASTSAHSPETTSSSTSNSGGTDSSVMTSSSSYSAVLSHYDVGEHCQRLSSSSAVSLGTPDTPHSEAERLRLGSESSDSSLFLETLSDSAREQDSRSGEVPDMDSDDVFILMTSVADTPTTLAGHDANNNSSAYLDRNSIAATTSTTRVAEQPAVGRQAEITTRHSDATRVVAQDEALVTSVLNNSGHNETSNTSSLGSGSSNPLPDDINSLLMDIANNDLFFNQSPPPPFNMRDFMNYTPED
ncbi:stress response protein NST1 [Aplysia californica]|uniref:Stress response protein NST1 n=1 Tax=Aplysia californica TaxID=6500 RepID=A0ABM0ZX46_APLCA|nr:stress response protein NST1 [Aplysia californica]